MKRDVMLWLRVYIVANIWRYPVRCRVIFASALESVLYIFYTEFYSHDNLDLHTSDHIYSILDCKILDNIWKLGRVNNQPETNCTISYNTRFLNLLNKLLS